MITRGHVLVQLLVQVFLLQRSLGSCDGEKKSRLSIRSPPEYRSPFYYSPPPVGLLPRFPRRPFPWPCCCCCCFCCCCCCFCCCCPPFCSLCCSADFFRFFAPLWTLLFNAGPFPLNQRKKATTI